MKISIYLVLVYVIIFSACKSDQVIKPLKIERKIKLEISENPIWLVNGCDKKVIRYKVNNASNRNLVAIMGSDTLLLEPPPPQKGFGRLKGEWESDFFVSADKKYKELKIIDLTENEVLLVTNINYYVKGDTISYYSSGRILPNKAYSLCHTELCWPNYNGPTIPSSRTYIVEADKDQFDEIFGDEIQRTISLKNVSLIDSKTKKRYPIKPDVTHIKKIKNSANLKINRVSHTVRNNGDVNLPDEIIYEGQSHSLPKKSFKITSTLTGPGGPSYIICDNIDGHSLRGIIRDCINIDTLESIAFGLPTDMDIILTCKEK